MLTKALVLLALSLSCLGRPDGFEPGPEPGEGVPQEDKKHNKRQFLLSPLAPQPYPYIPVYIPYPQVVEVHHIVMLQGPACVPQPFPQPFPPAPTTTPPPTSRPPVTYPPPPTPRPPVTYPPPPTPDGGLDDRTGMNMTDTSRPSRCVWAIVACCSPDSNNIRYSCFELLGCPGAFWGVNPCEKRVVQAAANTALNFYMADEIGNNSV